MASALKRGWKLLLAELFQIYVHRGTNPASCERDISGFKYNGFGTGSPVHYSGHRRIIPTGLCTLQGEFLPSRRLFPAPTGSSGSPQSVGTGKCFQQVWKSDAFVWLAARWHPSAHGWDWYFCFNFYAMIIKMLLWHYIFQRSILCLYLNNILLKFNVWVIQSESYINLCLLNYIREEWD